MSWGQYFTVYGCEVISEVKLGQKRLNSAIVFYDKINKFHKFYHQERIWGITGRAYFINNVVIIEYKDKRFGVK